MHDAQKSGSIYLCIWFESARATNAVSRPHRTPAPRFHAADPQVRRALEWGYRLFRIAYRQASEALREGHKTVEFPPQCFAPGRYMPLRS